MAERLRPSSSSRFLGLLISNLVFTDTQLGAGSDATVYAVEWRGTVCAAKRLHQILLQDQSRGGAEKLISNFEAECITWSKLRHPGVVQFLGVYLERNSRLPVLVIEKMDTSLRKYLADHSKEEFPLHLKAFVLRQISQALAYLHGQSQPLVHHDLSINNVLLNVVSFVAKLTDFGMSRAINPSSLSRKSSIKGTPAFMSPEALHDPPQYNETLDIFSFGNIILSTLTHEWPSPGPPTRYKGNQLIAVDEFKRRERYVEMFTAQEKQLFLPTVRQCLENRPDKRPSSAVLVRELRHIESSLSKDGPLTPIELLRQQLSAKEEECKQKDETLGEKDEVLKEKGKALREMAEKILRQADVIKGKYDALQHLDTIIREQDETLAEQNVALREKDATIAGQQDTIQEQQDTIHAQQAKIDQLCQQLSAKEEECRQKDETLTEKDWELGERDATMQVQQDIIQMQQAEIELLRNQSIAQQVEHPLKDWKKLGECQKVIQHSPEGGWYNAVAVNNDGLLAVTDELNECIHLLTNNGTLVRSIGEGIGGYFCGIAFDLKGNVLVTDWDNSKLVKLSQYGELLQTILHARSEGDSFSKPTGVSVSPEGLVYICDTGNHRVTVHNEEGKFLFAFGSKGSGPGCFDRPGDIAFGSDGLVYVADNGNKRVCALSKEGTFKQDLKTEYKPTYIAATSDSHLLITSCFSHNLMVYTLEGELIHQFGAQGSDPGSFNGPWGICVDVNGLVYVVDTVNRRVQVF